MGNVRHFQEQLSQFAQQRNAVATDGGVLVHDQHVIEEAVYRCACCRQLLQAAGVVALLEQWQSQRFLLLHDLCQGLLGVFTQQRAVYPGTVSQFFLLQDVGNPLVGGGE